MDTEISLLVIIAIIVTIMEVFLATFLIKKQKMKPWQVAYMSIPAIVAIWFVALFFS